MRLHPNFSSMFPSSKLMVFDIHVYRVLNIPYPSVKAIGLAYLNPKRKPHKVKTPS